MPFVRPSLETIIARIETDITSRLTGGVALLRRALLKILARVFAGAIHTLYGYNEYLSLQILPDLAETDWLDRHAFCWGLARIKATYAHGDVVFSGTNGTSIPMGTIVVRDDGVEFATTEDGVISSGNVTLDVQATTLYPGDIGNTSLGIVVVLLSPITNIDDNATVDTGGIAGGIDEETDEDLRDRILERIRNPPAGGSESDYKQASLVVSGVANAYVYPNMDVLDEELGHVTVVVLGDDPKVPGAGILADVQTAVDAIKPVTATLHVEPIDSTIIDIDVEIIPNTSALQTEIENNVIDLFDKEGEPGGTILLSHLRDAILRGGVNDYQITDIEVDSISIGVNDIELTDYQYPILGTITFSLLT